MSTRSFIAIKKEDGYEGIYCHFDGYPEGVGKILYRHYKDEKKVKELIALGNISSLGEEIGNKHDFNDRPDNETTAYGRDRGEAETKPTFCATKAELKDVASECSCEYLYIFENEKWYMVKL